MSISIADMERVALGGDALRMGGDVGDVIELGDLSDDLGLSMLMNPSKASVNSGRDTSNRVINMESIPSVSFNERPSAPRQDFSFGSESANQQTINSIPLEPLEPISIGNFDSQPIDMNNFGGPPVDVGVSKSFGGLFGNNQSATGPGVQLSSPTRDPEAEKKEKGDYLNKLQRLEAKGFPVVRKFTMDNSLEEIKTEYFRLVDARQLETSIKFQRQMLMGAITGMEWLNGRFDPFDVKLEGWSESVHENVEDFDEIFEELYDKYKDRGKMSPEMRLIMAVGGSGFMCHVSNTFFRSKMPTMDDVLKNNPQLARQMAAAAAQQAGPGFGNFMGMAMGVQPSQGPQMQMPHGPSFPGNGGPTPSAAPTGAFFGASAATPTMEYVQPPMAQTQRPVARREMSGPTGVDDILKTFDEVRASENAANAMNGFQMASGVVTQPAVAAVMTSAMSEDGRSMADSAMTGATGSLKPRRRRAQPPVGNTVSLNV
jgi:hypothetical protein